MIPTKCARATITLALGLLMAGAAGAANYPCSKSKGGVHHCENGKFICNDGSVSASKRICGASDGASDVSNPKTATAKKRPAKN